MDYEKFKQLIKREMMSRDIWKDTYTFQFNKNIRGQSKSIFILDNDKKKYIAKYFNYTEDIDIKINENDWQNLKSINDYLNYLDENFAVQIEEISEGLALKKRCFTRYVIASNETTNVFPKVYFNIEEINFDCSVGGILLEEAINGLTLEEYLRNLKCDKYIKITECIKFLKIISKKMCEYFLKDFVHRDLSPDNIMIIDDSNDKDYKIIDPGVVKIVSRNSTKGRVKFCKDSYSSPEQYLGYGSSVDFTSDIYILGIVIYEFITGINLINRFYRPDILPHNEINAMLDRTVEDWFYEDIEESPLIDRLYTIIKKMLQCRKEDRFKTIESFADVIETLNLKGDDIND